MTVLTTGRYWLAAALICGATAAHGVDRLEFNRHIRPILSDNCFLCHGPDANARAAGLRLDVREEALAAVVPGDASASKLVERITSADTNHVMPPPESERSLSADEIALLMRWVDEGAEYQAHWAYIPPKVDGIPPVQNDLWVRNPIDSFVLASLEEQGMRPSPEADRVTLIRRLHFDLVGLPPAPGAVDAFLRDTRPDAYERLVDQLLASPHFGERLAVYWLDLVRYADTVGYHGDQVRGAFGYRDYVIDAFNANMPFDQFTREQLAGDLLPNPTQEQLLASGYNRLNMVTREGGAQDKDYLIRYAADRTRTTASVWLGSSLACAQCHDHKFDPFTLKDFYRFSAFFADIDENGVQSELGNEGPFPPYLEFPTENEQAELARLDAKIAELEALLAEAQRQAEAAEAAGDEVAVVGETAVAGEAAAIQTAEPIDAKAIADELAGVKRERTQVEYGVLHSVITENREPRMTRVLPRGNWMDESGEVVEPGIPTFLGDTSCDGERATRLDLAAWLTSDENPLTARTFVNRLWYLYFGTGISKVLDDLGSQGEWPKHPELLDYLAVEFMENGWDIKHMVREIVTSATYRQSSMAGRALKEKDPYNRLLARQSRFRLNAELVRDNALTISGLLVEDVGGPSVFPYQPAGYYRELNFPEREYQVDTGADLYRRSVYMHWQRTFLHPTLLAFDAPTREECTAERTISNSPQQALVLLNDPIFVEASRVFAEHILQQGGANFDERLQWAYRRALSRDPLQAESDIMAALLEKHRAYFNVHPEDAAKYLEVGDKPMVDGLDAVELAAWSSVARTMFNLHETIYRY